MACAPSDDSDQPGHLPSLIRVFAVRMKKARILSYPLSAQRRHWSDWANAQADLSLCWAHIVGFVTKRLISSLLHYALLAWPKSWSTKLHENSLSLKKISLIKIWCLYLLLLINFDPATIYPFYCMLCQNKMFKFKLKFWCCTSLTLKLYLSRSTTKPTKRPVCPAKTQISLGICPVWSEFAVPLMGSWSPKAFSCGHWILIRLQGGCPGWSEPLLFFPGLEWNRSDADFVKNVQV